VHEIKSDLFPIDAEMAVIREPLRSRNQVMVQQMTAPLIEAYTRSRDLDIETS